MKNVLILHGAGETPQSFWYPWLQTELEKKGYKVTIPQLPDAEDPRLNKWLPAAKEFPFLIKLMAVN